ncbi:MAG: LD-carboxypeptidase [Flavobacteriales bacterium]|nr:LD-carboxypeptidase [Flavobacteriales bacterium]
MALIPPFLQPGDTIGIISTARQIGPEIVQHAIDHLEHLGYRVLVGANAYRQFNQYAGTDEERASDLQWALDHPEIKAILCSRGGYGTARLLDLVNWNAFRRKPKWISGFSDITALHLFVNVELGIASVHSTMPVNMDPESDFFDPDNLSSLVAVWQGRYFEYPLPKTGTLRYGGDFSGILIGGNLSVLYSMLGTLSWSDREEYILVIEDLDEYLYHVDRMMLNVRRNGLLDRCSGVLLGGLTRMHDNAISFGKTAEEIILEHLSTRNIPYYSGLDLGHVKRNLAIPLGVRARVAHEMLYFQFE